MRNVRVPIPRAPSTPGPFQGIALLVLPDPPGYCDTQPHYHTEPLLQQGIVALPRVCLVCRRYPLCIRVRRPSYLHLCRWHGRSNVYYRSQLHLEFLVSQPKTDFQAEKKSRELVGGCLTSTEARSLFLKFPQLQ